MMIVTVIQQIRVILEKRTVPQLGKYPAFYGTRRLTKSGNWSMSPVRSTHAFSGFCREVYENFGLVGYYASNSSILQMGPIRCTETLHILILSYTLCLLVSNLSPFFYRQNPICTSPLPNTCHMPHPPKSLFFPLECLVKIMRIFITSFPNLITLSLFGPNVFFKPYIQTHSTNVHPLMLKAKFQPIQKYCTTC